MGNLYIQQSMYIICIYVNVFYIEPLLISEYMGIFHHWMCNNIKYTFRKQDIVKNVVKIKEYKGKEKHPKFLHSSYIILLFLMFIFFSFFAIALNDVSAGKYIHRILVLFVLTSLYLFSFQVCVINFRPICAYNPKIYVSMYVAQINK